MSNSLEVGKKYITRGGLSAVCVYMSKALGDHEARFLAVVTYRDGSDDNDKWYYDNGRYHSSQITDQDILLGQEAIDKINEMQRDLDSKKTALGLA